MSKDGRKASRLCMAGLIVSVIVLLIDIVLRVLCFGKNINDDSLSQLLFLILPIAAVILSITGIKDAIKKDLRGIAPAVYGIVISSFEIIVIIFWFAVAVQPLLAYSGSSVCRVLLSERERCVRGRCELRQQAAALYRALY